MLVQPTVLTHPKLYQQCSLLLLSVLSLTVPTCPQCWNKPPYPPNFPTDSSGVRPHNVAVQVPVEIGDSVFYRCPGNRNSNGENSWRATCVSSNRYILHFDSWPTCQCKSSSFSCETATSRWQYRDGSNHQTLHVNIPNLTENPSSQVALKLDLTTPLNRVNVSSTTSAVSLSSPVIFLSMAGSTSLDFVYQGRPQVPKWELPCVVDIQCQQGVSSPVTDLTGSLIIGAIGLLVTLLLLACVCFLKHRETRKETQERRDRVSFAKQNQVAIVPAAHQNCYRNNHHQASRDLDRANTIDPLNNLPRRESMMKNMKDDSRYFSYNSAGKAGRRKLTPTNSELLLDHGRRKITPTSMDHSKTSTDRSVRTKSRMDQKIENLNMTLIWNNTQRDIENGHKKTSVL